MKATAPPLSTQVKPHVVDGFPARHAEALRRLDAIDPAEYARSRNALGGAVTGLSPYFTHGVIGMREAVARLLQNFATRNEISHLAAKFLQVLK